MMISERLQQHLHNFRQPALRVADELLEDLVRHLHELLHPGQALLGKLNGLLPRAGFPERALVEHLAPLTNRLEDRAHPAAFALRGDDREHPPPARQALKISPPLAATVLPADDAPVAQRP